MKYPTVTGWSGPAAKASFFAEISERVTNHERWDHRAVELELFSRIEEQISAGDSLDYELSCHDTVSKNTELISFDGEEFAIEWRNII